MCPLLPLQVRWAFPKAHSQENAMFNVSFSSNSESVSITMGFHSCEDFCLSVNHRICERVLTMLVRICGVKQGVQGQVVFHQTFVKNDEVQCIQKVFRAFSLFIYILFMSHTTPMYTPNPIMTMLEPYFRLFFCANVLKRNWTYHLTVLCPCHPIKLQDVWSRISPSFPGLWH